jgi:hypothetical protein
MFHHFADRLNDLVDLRVNMHWKYKEWDVISGAHLNAGPTLLTKHCGRQTQENKQRTQTETHATETHRLWPNRRSVLLTHFSLQRGILPLKQ